MYADRLSMMLITAPVYFADYAADIEIIAFAALTDGR